MTTPRPRIAAAVLLAAAFTAQLDLFIVNVALPVLKRDFAGAGLPTLSWTLNAYAIVFAAALVPAGRIADELGRRRSLLTGVAVFTAASLGCALAPGIGALIAFRAIQAVGAAMAMPVSLALLLGLVERDRHALVTGLWAGMGGTAATLGPSVGGLLLQAGWRWIFLVNVPIGALVLLAGRRVLPRDGGRSGAAPDMVGAAALAAALALAVLAIVEGPTWGWGSWPWVASLAGATLLAALFAQQNARHAQPTVEWPLLRVRDFAAANAAVAIFYVGMTAMILGSFLFLQGVWGYSALEAGAAFALGGAASVVCALTSGWWTRRVGRRHLAIAGPLFLAAAGAWWYLRLGQHPDFLGGYLPGIVLAGMGTGTSQGPLFASVSGLPADRAATGSALLTTVRQVSSAIGVAVLVAVLGGHADAHDFRRAWVIVAATAAAASLVTVVGVRRPARAARELSAAA